MLVNQHQVMREKLFSYWGIYLKIEYLDRNMYVNRLKRLLLVLEFFKDLKAIFACCS